MKASAYRIISLTSCGVHFVAFLLFLLVGLSLTIIKPIYLFSIRSTAVEQQPLSIATELKFGVWGVCASGQLNPGPGTCFGPKLGYNVSSFIDLIEAGISTDIVTVFGDAVLVVLVLHPISAGLAFISLISSLFLTSHGVSIFTLIVTIINALVASLSLGIDLALVLVARNSLSSSGLSIAIDFGNGVWMVLAGVVLTWTGVILLSARACYCLGVRRSPNVTVRPEEKLIPKA